MKRIKYITIVFTCLALFGACSDYLDLTPEQAVNEEDPFRTYPAIQGYLDQCYELVVDYNTIMTASTLNLGDDVVGVDEVSSAVISDRGDYWELLNGVYSVLKEVYNNAWKGIRISNMVIENIDLFTEATGNQKEIILGQAYFFRAFFHWEITRNWGGIPYIDRVLQPDEIFQDPRLSVLETIVLVAADFDEAAKMLPETWSSDQIGRVTKGAAYSLKARALLFAGSPLANKETGYNYNNTYLEQSADAAWQALLLGSEVDGGKGVYKLAYLDTTIDGVDYKINYNFAKNNNEYPITPETVFQRTKNSTGNKEGMQLMRDRHTWLYSNRRLTKPNPVNNLVHRESPTLNLVDKFETINGLPINDPASGWDENNPWENRDPRLKAFILCDRDQAFNNAKAVCELYVGGRDNDGVNKAASSFMVRKFWPWEETKNPPGNYSNFRWVTPIVRFADVYLMYAEAVNEVYGPQGTAPGASLTAVEAINIVRERAKMPNVNSKFTGDKDKFRARIWNERSVELCFEDHRWVDIRRWRIAHLQEYKDLYTLDFDKNWTFFSKRLVLTRIFEEKHYWVPFPKEQVQFYEGFYQNPGW